MRRTITPPSFDRWHVVKLATSLAALTVLVVAAPIVLVILGGVPFSHVGASEVSRSLSSTHAGDSRLVSAWIAGSALLLAWLTWMWMTVCVVVELRSWATGRSPARLPASRTLQSVAACLVGTALAMSTVGRAIPNRALSPRTATGATSPSWRPMESSDVSRSSVSTGPPPLIGLADVSTRSDVIPMARLLDLPDSTGDTERTDESDVRRASELVLTGRQENDQPTGRMPAPLPGAVLAPEVVAVGLPLDRTSETALGQWAVDHEPTAMAVPSSGTVPGSADPLTVPRTRLVRSRETLWSIAEDELGTALRWRELAEYNYGIRQADGRSLDKGHWVSAGWRLLLPPTDGATSEAGTSPPTPLVPWAPSTRSGEVGPFAPPAPIAPAMPVLPLGGGVVGAGVVRLLDRLRRVQQRHRPEGGYIRLPAGEGSRFEQRLRIGDGWSITHEVDVAVRRAAESSVVPRTEESPARAPAPAPAPPDNALQVLGVRIHPEVIELVLTGEGRRVVVVERTAIGSTSAGSSSEQRRAAAPLLATVGEGPFGPVMVNLEALGSLVVSGNPDAADAVVRALALELATSYWAGQFSVAVVGFGSELDRFEGVTSHADVADLIRVLYRRRIEGAEHLRSTGYMSFSQARHFEASERWAPLVVICGPAVNESDVIELLAIASDPVLGTSVVAVGERTEAQYSVRLTGEAWSASLGLLGTVAFPQRIEADEWSQVTSLLETAATRESVLSSEEPYVNLPIRLPVAVEEGALARSQLTHPRDPVPVAAVDERQGQPEPDVEVVEVGADDGEPDVVVAVLGPIEIRGAVKPFTRAWAEELVVYLAMHPSGVSNEVWATALWPDRLMAPSSLHSTASVARRSLGQSAAGRDHLPRSHGRLALARTVGTDWDRFVALAGTDRPERWRQALTLVRGRPFEGLRASDWPILEGIAPAIEAAVVDLSGRLAGTYLRQGDAQGAEWAARRGLVVSPYDERLYRMLMRAADAGGNPAGVDAAMAELLRLVADDIEPFDAVHPSTMDLYRQLSRRRKLPTQRC